MEELKPCKCGSVDIHEEVMSDNKSHIACQVCGFEIITDYPEWSFELWNTRAKEVIMSEPLSNKKHRYECICCHCGKPFYGDKREVSCPNCSKTNRSLSKILNFEHKQHTPSSDSGVVTGYNQAIDDLDQRSPDVEKLARIIYEQQYNRNININSRCPDWKKEAPYVKERFFLLAQEIINKINVWVVKKGN